MTDTLVRDDSAPRSKRRVRKGGRWRSLMLLGLFVVAGFAVTGVLPVGEYLDRGSDVRAAQIQLDELTARNDILAADVEALYTDQEIERIAREQYGLVREGEVGYIITTPDGLEQTSEPQFEAQALPEPVPVAEGRSFLERIWDFVTGSDQPNDG